MPLREIRFFVGLVVFLAVGWAQVSGFPRGFLCEGERFGEVSWTREDHCHGPHTTAAHDAGDHSIAHRHGEEEGGTHHHAAVVEPLLAMLSGSLAAPVAPMLWMIRVTPDEFPSLHTLRAATSPGEMPRWSRAAPEWPRRLAQAIALRV
ncbi:MAG: hypothetical protein KGS60_01365 [Verrucomicrobia bacterium]|nr:hypothetical protein [Verrucomicrobiota bacterium]